MLLLPGKDKKKLAAVILGASTPDFVGKEKGGYEVEMDYEPPEDDEMAQLDDAVMSCCEKVMECLDDRDVEGFAEAMRDLVDVLTGR